MRSGSRESEQEAPANENIPISDDQLILELIKIFRKGEMTHRCINDIKRVLTKAGHKIKKMRGMYCCYIVTLKRITLKSIVVTLFKYYILI